MSTSGNRNLELEFETVWEKYWTGMLQEKSRWSLMQVVRLYMYVKGLYNQ